MENIEPTAEEYDELIAFLPKFYYVGYDPIIEWKGGENIEGNVDFMRWPIYEPQVMAFFQLLKQDCWIDYDFNLYEIGRQILDEDLIFTADLQLVKQMLSYCARGEKFISHGHMGKMIKDGHVARLLQRLRTIKAEKNIT